MILSLQWTKCDIFDLVYYCATVLGPGCVRMITILLLISAALLEWSVATGFFLLALIIQYFVLKYEAIMSWAFHFFCCQFLGIDTDWNIVFVSFPRGKLICHKLSCIMTGSDSPLSNIM